LTVNPNWTFEEAIAEHDKEIAANPEKWNDPTTPLFQWCALQRLEIYRENFQNGNKYSLMLAIRICANHDLILPDWVSKAYITAFDGVQNYRNKSWDEVFGAPNKKGTNLNASRKKRELKLAVLLEVRRIYFSQLPRPAIDILMYEEVGKKFNIGKTLAAEYYYSALKMLPDLNPIHNSSMNNIIICEPHSERE
jgi:hypothetical protein